MSFQWREVVWYNVFVLLAWHLGALYALLFLLPSAGLAQILVLWISLWFLSGLGITAGAHRLWSHRAYKATLPLRVFLMLMNSMAFQGDLFEWCRDHRTHHKGSETESDPHNAKRGFFFAHCGWVMVRKHPRVREEGRKINCNDLLEDPVVAFQMKTYLVTVLLMCYGLPTLMGHFLFSSAWNGFWIGGVFRHVWVLHMTWLVNSAAHLWGDRPYAPEINPAENWLVVVAAIGEGWHNFHHKYPSDYAAGEFGFLSGQWNPTKLFIDFCVALGLASHCKRSSTAAATRRMNEEKERMRLSVRDKKEKKLVDGEEDIADAVGRANFSSSSSLTDRFFDRFFFGRSENQFLH